MASIPAESSTGGPGPPEPDPRYSPQARGERLIALGRVVMSAVSLVAVWRDPTEPTSYAEICYALLSTYVAYALLVTLLVWSPKKPLGQLPLVTHVIDLCTFTLFLYFTEAPNSPFFVYFTFSVVCATVRWYWRGALWTGLAAIVTFLAMGLYVEHVLRDPLFELNRFVIRSVYLAVAAILLASLGAYEERARREMTRLAAWPSALSRDAGSMLSESLQHAARILDSGRLVMVWEESEEPYLNVASWSRGGFQWTREAPDSYSPLVAEPLRDSDFLCPDVNASQPLVLRTAGGEIEGWRGAPCHASLCARYGMRSVVSVVAGGKSVTGRLFILDKQPTSDDLTLGRIVAAGLAARMDQFYLAQQLERAAAAEERIRLARDLHDGILQSLTGVTLQLRALVRSADVGSARERLEEIESLIGNEQRELRFFITELRRASMELEPGSTLAMRLKALCERIERQWGIRVEANLDVDGSSPLGEPLGREICRMVQEGLTNAARHAHATVLRLGVKAKESGIEVAIEDDGQGFPFRGQYDLASLDELQLGPVSLKARVASLGGSLVIDSGPSGARVHIAIPCEAPGVTHAH